MIKDNSGYKKRTNKNKIIGNYESKYRLLEYYESQTENPSDLLRIYSLENEEYVGLENQWGFNIKIKHGIKHSAISRDPLSYRKFREYSLNITLDKTNSTTATSINNTDRNFDDTATITFTFSEAVIGFTLADVRVANGSITELSSDNG